MPIFKVRRNTAAAAASSNPVLAAGEMGYETDTKRLKVGDGTTAWSSLQEAGSATYVPSVIIQPGATSGTAVQAAITSLVTLANGGEIVLAPGAHTWDSTPKLPRSLTNALTIRGLAGAIITLTSGGVRAFDFDWTASHQTFQHLRLFDLAVDAANLGGKHHVLLGTWISGAQVGRLNLDDIRIERCRIYNVLTDPIIATNHRIGICLTAAHSASGEATQNTLTGITIRDVDITGGNAGVLITGGGPLTGVNVWMDDIYLEHVNFTGAAPTQFFASSGFHIGGNGFGRKATLRDCVSKNSGDNGIEVNAFQEALIDNCSAVDAWNVGFYAANYHALLDPNTAVYTWRNCRRTVKDITPDASYGSGFRVRDNDPNAYGRIVLDNCSSMVTSPGPLGAPAYGFGLNGATVKEVVLRDVRSRIDNIAITPSVQAFPTVFYLNPAGTCKTTGRLIIEASGTKSGATNYGFRCVTLGGADHQVDLVAEADVSITGMPSSTIYLFNVGEDASTNVGGRARVLIRNLGSDSAPRGFRFRTGMTIRKNFIVSGDFSGMAGGSEVVVDDAALKPQIQLTDMVWKTLPANGTPSVSASPASYQNVSMRPETVIVRANGATITGVTITPGVGGTAVDTGVLAGAFTLQNGDTITVTYSAGTPVIRTMPGSVKLS